MKGFLYLAERPQSFTLSELEESIGFIGAQLRNSWSGKITRLSNQGDQIPTNESELKACLEGPNPFNFQFWLSDDTDVICTFRRVANDIVSHSYDFDGLNRAEVDRVVQWGMCRFTQKAPTRNALLLVVDRANAAEEFDWDAVVKGHTPAPKVLPDIFGVDSAIMQLQAVASLHETKFLDGTLLLIRPRESASHG